MYHEHTRTFHQLWSNLMPDIKWHHVALSKRETEAMTQCEHLHSDGWALSPLLNTESNPTCAKGQCPQHFSRITFRHTVSVQASPVKVHSVVNGTFENMFKSFTDSNHISNVIKSILRSRSHHWGRHVKITWLSNLHSLYLFQTVLLTDFMKPSKTLSSS